MTSHDANLSRVTQRIGSLILEFVRARWDGGRRQFFMRELHDYIFEATQIAPASPDRILRLLRQSGQFDYRVLDRRASLYEISRFGPPQAAPRTVNVEPVKMTQQQLPI